MGPKLNLEFLTPEECEQIIEVIQKDLVLQHVEQQRIWKINEEVSDNNELCKILSKQESFNENHCLYCFLKFRLIFRRKSVCKTCGYNFCSGCIVFDAKQNEKSCVFCVKRRQCERQSLEWFYSKVRSKFKRSGSSKVIRSLCLRNSTSATLSKSVDIQSNPKCLSSYDSIDDSASYDELQHISNYNGSNNYCTLETNSDEIVVDEKVENNGSDVEDKKKTVVELTDKLLDMQSLCIEEAEVMKGNVYKLINIEKSLANIDNALKCMDDAFLDDHYHTNLHHHHHCDSDDCSEYHHYSSNETMLNLATNQISDITAVAAGLLEKTMAKAIEIVRCEFGKDDSGSLGRDDDDGDDPIVETTNDDDKEIDPIEVDDTKIDQSGAEKIGQSGKDDKLKSIEKEVYKTTSKTYILEGKLTDLEEDITSTGDDVLNKKVEYFEGEVAELVVEVHSNQKDVELIERKVAELTEE